MSYDQLFDIDLEIAAYTTEKFAIGYRDSHGSHSLGRLEEDPEMMEYEELLDLGECLAELS